MGNEFDNLGVGGDAPQPNSQDVESVGVEIHELSAEEASVVEAPAPPEEDSVVEEPAEEADGPAPPVVNEQGSQTPNDGLYHYTAGQMEVVNFLDAMLAGDYGWHFNNNVRTYIRGLRIRIKEGRII